MTSSLEDARNLVLQKIGRNVVNIQRLEAMLRQLLIASRLESSLGEFQQVLERRTTSVSRLPMGHLVDELSRTIYAEADMPEAHPESLKEPWIGISIRMEGGKVASRAWRAELMKVVHERNVLVHKLVAEFDLNSVESCGVLGADLDEQRTRIVPVFEHLRAVLCSLREAQASLIADLSDAFEEVAPPDRPDGT